MTLRCTQKLLRRVGASAGAGASSPTTVLGDWYANLVYAHPEQLVLCMNERSLLVVVLPAKDFKNIGPRFRARVALLLERIGVPLPAVAAEEGEMMELAFGPTASRKVLGCLNEAAFALSDALDRGRAGSVSALEDHLSGYIYSTTKYRKPRELALELFSASGTASGAPFRGHH